MTGMLAGPQGTRPSTRRSLPTRTRVTLWWRGINYFPHPNRRPTQQPSSCLATAHAPQSNQIAEIPQKRTHPSSRKACGGTRGLRQVWSLTGFRFSGLRVIWTIGRNPGPRDWHVYVTWQSAWLPLHPLGFLAFFFPAHYPSSRGVSFIAFFRAGSN